MGGWVQSKHRNIETSYVWTNSVNPPNNWGTGVTFRGREPSTISDLFSAADVVRRTHAGGTRARGTVRFFRDATRRGFVFCEHGPGLTGDGTRRVRPRSSTRASIESSVRSCVGDAGSMTTPGYDSIRSGWRFEGRWCSDDDDDDDDDDARGTTTRDECVDVIISSRAEKTHTTNYNVNGENRGFQRDGAPFDEDDDDATRERDHVRGGEAQGAEQGGGASTSRKGCDRGGIVWFDFSR